MEDFRCQYCGYNMTGIEQFANQFDMIVYPEFDGYVPPIGTGMFNGIQQNKIKCPSCGRPSGFLRN